MYFRSARNGSYNSDHLIDNEHQLWYVCILLRTIMNQLAIQKLKVIFYRTEAGIEPVRIWLTGLLKSEKKAIGEDIMTVQYGWPLGMPLVDNLGQGLWEVRSRLPSKKIARIIFFMDNQTMILVHGFIKKTQRTPKSELDLARQRKKRYQSQLKRG